MCQGVGTKFHETLSWQKITVVGAEGTQTVVILESLLPK
jgi:hypothetical protein